MSRDKSNDVVMDAYGRLWPSSEAERARAERVTTEGQMIAAVFRLDNQIAVHVQGPPSLALAEALEITAAGMRRALGGEPGTTH